MADELEVILGRVAAGELTPAEAEQLIGAATVASTTTEVAARIEPEQGSRRRFGWPRPPAAGAPPTPPQPPNAPLPPVAPLEGSPRGDARRIVRLQVIEGGRSVVNLRIPMTWAALAGSVLPGLSNEHADRLRDAIRSGTVGRILEVQDDDGDGVIISTE